MARIAAALGLPKASLADSRQMIEGLLAEEREPWSVQVESDGGQAINLRDASGIFLNIPPSELDRDEGEPSSRREEGSPSDEDGSPKGGRVEVVAIYRANIPKLARSRSRREQRWTPRSLARRRWRKS